MTVTALVALAVAGWLGASGPGWSRAGALRLSRVLAVRVGGLPLGARVGAAGLMTAATVAVGGTRVVIPFGVGLLLLVVVGRRLQAARGRRRADAARESDVRVLRALAAELRAGASPGEAMRGLGQGSEGQGSDGQGSDGQGSDGQEPGGLELRLARAATVEALGGDPAPVLAGAPGYGPSLAAAWTVSRRSGAPLAEPVRRIAEGAADDLRIAREVDAALASARSSAQLLALLPLAGALLGAFGGTGALRLLLTTGVGQACLVAGVGLDLAGLLWLDRLAARAAR